MKSSRKRDNSILASVSRLFFQCTRFLGRYEGQKFGGQGGIHVEHVCGFGLSISRSKSYKVCNQELHSRRLQKLTLVKRDLISGQALLELQIRFQLRYILRAKYSVRELVTAARELQSYIRNMSLRSLRSLRKLCAYCGHHFIGTSLSSSGQAVSKFLGHLWLWCESCRLSPYGKSQASVKVIDLAMLRRPVHVAAAPMVWMTADLGNSDSENTIHITVSRLRIGEVC